MLSRLAVVNMDACAQKIETAPLPSRGLHHFCWFGWPLTVCVAPTQRTHTSPLRVNTHRKHILVSLPFCARPTRTHATIPGQHPTSTPPTFLRLTSTHPCLHCCSAPTQHTHQCLHVLPAHTHASTIGQRARLITCSLLGISFLSHSYMTGSLLIYYKGKSH